MKHSLAYTIAFASVAVALPQKAHPRADDPVPAMKGINASFVPNSCNEAEQNHIKQAAIDAQLLADALNTWVPGGKNQDVMNMYMGNGSSSRGDPTEPSGGNYREIIQNNTINEAALYRAPLATKNQLYIMCNEDKFWPNKTEAKCTEKDWAWTWNNPGKARVDHYMRYCPNYFNKLPTLAEDVAKAKKNNSTIKILDGLASNKASAFFHETFHMDVSVGNPPIWDQEDDKDVYGPSNVANTAATRNAAISMLIADSYTMAGLAIYYRDTLNWTDFPRPGGRPSGSPLVIGKKLDNPVAIKAAADPNDPNSTPSGDWIPL